jgi:hypothetical protein
MQTMILRTDSGSEFIEVLSGSSLRLFFLLRTGIKSLPFVCKTEDVALNKQLLNKTAKTAANNKIF